MSKMLTRFQKKQQQGEKDVKDVSTTNSAADTSSVAMSTTPDVGASSTPLDLSVCPDGYDKKQWKKLSEMDKMRYLFEQAKAGEAQAKAGEAQAKAGEAQAKAELEAAGQGGITSIRTTLGNIFAEGIAVPSAVERLKRISRIDVDEYTVKSAGASSRSGTALLPWFYVPISVTPWESFPTDIEQLKKKIKIDAELPINVENIHQPPRKEEDMVDNWALMFGKVLNAVGFKNVSLASETEVSEFNEKVKANIKSRPDLALVKFNKETTQGFVMFEGKADDKWPAQNLRNAHLCSIWTVKPTKAQYSLEQKPIIQLTTHMCLAKSACGVLFNGIVAHLCHLDKDGTLECTGPYDMSTAEFWNAFLPFVLYANSLEPWSGNLVPTMKEMKAAASGALDDDPDRFGDGEDVKVEVPGPSLPQGFVYENFQEFLNNGTNERPMVWVRNVEGQDVVVKAVDHEMDASGFFRSELAHEVEVYKNLNEKGARDFIPEFVISGKLPGGDRSAIVTKFAGDCVEFWKPKNKSEAKEVYNKAVDALTRLHKLGYLHGDVALRNFVLDPETKKVRVIDLGRATELDEKSNPSYEVDALKSEFQRSFPRYFE